MYVELHARSAFSFLEGASAPEELIGLGKEMGMASMALLDRDPDHGRHRVFIWRRKKKLCAHIGHDDRRAGDIRCWRLRAKATEIFAG